MRYAVIVGVVLGLIGCGDVSLMMTLDAGDVGEAGAGGAAGGTAGAAGGAGGGMGGEAGAPPACEPDVCNDCVGGQLTPKANGTSCGVRSCDATYRYYTKYECRSGACEEIKQDCCTIDPVGACIPQTSGATMCYTGAQGSSGPVGGCP